MANNRNKQPADDDDDDEPALSDAARTEIQAMITGAVGGAVKDHFKRTLGPAVKAAIDPALGEIKELLAKREQPASDGGDEDDDDDPDVEAQAKPKAGKGKPVQQPQGDPKAETKAVRQLQALQRKMEAMETTRAAEREQAAATTRDVALREHLVKANVKPELVRGAMAVLRESTKLDPKTNEWTFVKKGDGFEEELDLAIGVDGWLKTDEGKAHIAAPTQQPRSGSGMPRVIGAMPQLGGRTGQPATDAKGQKAEKMAAADADLMAGVMALVGGPQIG